MYVCMHAHMHIYWWFEFFPKICINTQKIYTYMCVSCVFLMFSGIHIQKAEVLSARFPKEYDHKNLAAKHPKLCTYFIQNSVYLWFFHTSIHTYMRACTHAHLLMVWVFSKDMYRYKKNIHTYMCVSCVFLMFSRIHIQKAEVLSVRFPKEYDHKNLAAKHPNLCTYFIQNSVLFVIFPYIHTYIHACMHTCTFIDGLIFSRDMYKYKKYTYMCVSCVFWCFLEFIFKSRGSKCLVPQGVRPQKSCSEASQVVYIFHSKLCLFVIFPYIHTYIYACMHTCTFIDGLSFFPKICINTKKIHTCVSCVFLMFSRIHIQKTEVLSVRFPKEYDHKNLAAKHPNLCTYFIQNSVYLWFFHTSIHTCMHAHMHIYWWFEFLSKDMYKYKKIYICVCRVFFWCFLEFIFKKQRF